MSSTVQIVYLTVSQIYQLESLAEKELERLQDEIENDNDLLEGEEHFLQEELEELEEAKSSLYQSHYYRHMYRATDFVRKDWKDEEVSND
mgnify:FL=1